MTRLVLSFSISSAVIFVGLLAAWIQSANFARAAELDRLQEQSEWYLRRVSGLRAELGRCDFELCVEDLHRHGDVRIGDRGGGPGEGDL